jgi:excisionase family DNA binding protein
MFKNDKEIREWITPNEIEANLAKESSQRLSDMLGEQSEYRIQLLDNGNPSEVLEIPASAMHMLATLLTEMAQGHAITLLPLDTDLTTQQAADMLNVSRPYLIQLLEAGEIPFHKVGTHRRVRSQDVVAYKDREDTLRLKALDELVAQAQALDMGY